MPRRASRIAWSIPRSEVGETGPILTAHAAPPPLFVYGADPGVVFRLYDGTVLWTLGYPQRGRERMRDALSPASEVSHPHSMAFEFGA